MSDFTSVFPEVEGLAPNKRVNYVHGLVLGVDELLQEELYLLEKDRSHNRTLHGFGTVCGLKVGVEAGEGGPEIQVAPGVAVSPSGHEINVPRSQCALLNEWLNSRRERVVEAMGSPAEGPVSLYLMLCYRECKTDRVPIPTGPCQSLEESTAPSRIADDFSLSLQLQPPPDYHFEWGMHQLSELLLSIPVETGGAMTLDEIKELVRGLKPATGSPPAPAPVSPPAGASIAPENVGAFLNAALLVWVTEVKPYLMYGTGETIPADPARHCVFLGRIDLTVESSETVISVDESAGVGVDETQRPYLVGTQDMQNYLGPVSTWLKTLTEGAVPEMSSTSVDDSGLVHLDGSETITGSKTLAAPLALSGAGRVEKIISMPAHQAHHGRGAARGLFSDMLPSMHYMTTGSNAFSGEALFAIPIPDDIDLSVPMQFRLIWGFQGTPEPGAAAFDWIVGARFFQADQSVPGSPFETVTVSVNEASERRNDVLTTAFQPFDSTIVLTADHRFGAMRVSMAEPDGSIPQVYLLSVDLRYVASRLGGGLS